ncbi:MAG: BrnA antitoxin family protein [Pyrinomonadaceae bacterium]
MKKQYDFNKGKRGAVVKPPRGKSRITIRLDDEILDWFRREVHKAGGGNYQTLINHALREHIKKRPEALEEVVRRVVREEVRRIA